MPAKVSVPDSLSTLLQHFRSSFSAAGYEVFTAMFTGFILRPVERTVCGMLTGAGLAGVWHHSRAHRFFANTRWDVRQVGLILGWKSAPAAGAAAKELEEFAACLAMEHDSPSLLCRRAPVHVASSLGGSGRD